MIVSVHENPGYSETFENNWKLLSEKAPETYDKMFDACVEVWAELSNDGEAHAEFKFAMHNALPVLSRYNIVELIGDSANTTGFILSNKHALRLYYNQHLYYRELNWYKNSDNSIFTTDQTSNTPEIYDNGTVLISGVICARWLETSQIISLESFVQFIHNEPLSNHDLVTFNVMIELLYNLANQIKPKYTDGSITLVTAVKTVLSGLYKYLRTGGPPLSHGSRTAIYHRFPRQLLTPLAILLIKAISVKHDPALTNIGIHINNPQKLFLFV